MTAFLGIAREPLYSPGKVDDDRAILEAVADLLGVRHRVGVAAASEELADPPPGTIVFAMCQGPEALARLERWERRGRRVVNSARAVRNCQRERTITALERACLPHPQSFLVPTRRPELIPDWVGEGAWVKRGDVHATEAGDVRRADGRDAARLALASLAERGIDTALVQRHVPGETIKFYAVRGSFFRAVPPPGLVLEASTEAALASLAERAAAALELEVFGGDVVYDTRQRAWLIDLNDWPSYGPCRVAAAAAIAAHLERAGREPSLT